MTLWIFGDSFSSDENKLETHQSWYSIIAQSLGTDLKNCSEFGAANEFTINEWSNQYNHIKPTDYVIVLLTSTRKTYFFKDYPEIGMPWLIDKLHYNEKWNNLPIEHQTSFINYYKYLHRESVSVLSVKSFLYWVNTVAGKLNNKIIVVKTFNDYSFDISDYSDLIISTGLSLIEISEREVLEDEWKALLINRTCYDTRKNHLSNDNHQCLANCILNSIKTHLLEFSETNFKLVR